MSTTMPYIAPLRRLAFASLFAAAASLLPTPRAALAQSRDTSFRLVGSAVVDVTMRSGRLVVRGVEGSTGAVRGASNDYQLRSSGVTLTLGPRDNELRGDDRAMELDLPRGVRLVVTTRSGDVDVRDITGGVEVHSTSGDVRLDRVGRRVIVETVSGDVFVSGGDQVRTRTVSGDLELRDVQGEVEVHTTSGNARIDGRDVARLSVEAMSGDVQFNGEFDAAARVQVSTHSGDVMLRLPGGASGRLEFSTVTGELAAGGPITLLPGDQSGSRRGRSARRYAFGPGSSDGEVRGLQIDLSTFSGDVRLVRASRF